jgi:serine/threonine protein kinase
VLEELARGGQGAVLKARHQQLGRLAAIKVLLRSGPKDKQRFKQEAQVLANLNHPGLLDVAECGEIDGEPYMAMDYVEGEDLKAIVARGIPSFDWTAKILQQVALALHYCHEQANEPLGLPGFGHLSVCSYSNTYPPLTTLLQVLTLSTCSPRANPLRWFPPHVVQCPKDLLL